MKTPPRISESLLRQVIAECGSPEKAAPELGVSVRTIYRWMAHYGIKRTYAAAA